MEVGQGGLTNPSVQGVLARRNEGVYDFLKIFEGKVAWILQQ